MKKDPEAAQRERYADVNQPGSPQRLGALTGVQADTDLAQLAMLAPRPPRPRPTGAPLPP
ncbi:hypothetical protein [Streptomyces sp. NPDC006691]|uniref:hypothetical protein n=1 Tax=Streptomyces sp. NPDC006691 TaxID=3364757 RepID=UPI003688EFB3